MNVKKADDILREACAELADEEAADKHGKPLVDDLFIVNAVERLERHALQLFLR